nr:DNA polymerase III subunit delta [Pseudomonas sp.]
VWDKRRPLVSKALQRHESAGWRQLLTDAQRIDEQIKGQAEGDPWIGLANLCLQLGGRRIGI